MAALVSRPPTLTDAIVRSAVYVQCVCVYIQRSPVLSRKVSLLALSMHPGLKPVQVGHLKSHYVVCTDSHIVRLAGLYKILWP